eukprot:1008071_1
MANKATKDSDSDSDYMYHKDKKEQNKMDEDDDSASSFSASSGHGIVDKNIVNEEEKREMICDIVVSRMDVLDEKDKIDSEKDIDKQTVHVNGAVDAT